MRKGPRQFRGNNKLTPSTVQYSINARFEVCSALLSRKKSILSMVKSGTMSVLDTMISFELLRLDN